VSYDRARDTFRDATEPDDTTVEAVWAGVHASTPQPHRRVVPVVATGIALAAAAAFFLLPEAPPPPLSATFAAEAPTAGAVTPHLMLTTRGTGALSGTQAAPRVEWTTGDLHVDLTPNQGVDLRIHTPHADVVVVGTSFHVQVGGLGTSVEVERGIVEVTCDGQAVRRLTRADRITCLPTTASGLLLRATLLLQDNVDPAIVLDTVDAGLSDSPAPPAVTRELSALRIELLGRLERYADAAEAARAFLAHDPGSHQAAVQAYLTGLEAAGY